MRYEELTCLVLYAAKALKNMGKIGVTASEIAEFIRREYNVDVDVQQVFAILRQLFTYDPFRDRFLLTSN